MTHQIIIKLNEKKFKPLLDSLNHNSYGESKSYSELVGKIIFCEYASREDKNSGKETKNKFHKSIQEKYDFFRKTGKLTKN